MNNDWKNMSLNNYVDIKNIEKQLADRKEELKVARVNLITPLYTLSKEHPELIGESLLPGNIDRLKLENLALRFNIIKQNVENSSMPELEKNKIMNSIDEITRKIQVNISSSENNQRSIEKVEEAKQARAQYLEQKYLERKNLNDELEKTNFRLKKLTEKRNQLSRENWEQSIIDAFNSEISIKEGLVNDLISKLDNLLSEPGLKDELDLYTEDRNKAESSKKELLENVKKEQKEREKKEHLEAIRNKLVEQRLAKKEENKEEIVEVESEPKPENANDIEIKESTEEAKKEETTSENKEEKKESTSLEALKPEKPKKVKEKHKAGPKLMEFMKKYAAPALGIAAIGAAVVGLFLNPAAAAIAFGSGLVLSEVKDSVLKK